MDLKNKIKFVGVDLDGTLLRDDKTLCPNAKEIITDAINRGIHIVPITGRPYSGIPQCVKDIDGIEYFITTNGAQIIDAKTEKSLFSFPLSNSQANNLIDLLKGYDCSFEIFRDNVGYITQELYDNYIKLFTGTPLLSYIKATKVVTDNLYGLLSSNDLTADEIFVVCKSNDVRNDLTKKLNEIDDIQQCLLGDDVIEVTRRGTDKGEALEVLCNYLGVDLSQTIAFGDGENDLLFLKKAGVSVAMQNAFDSIKAEADIIAKSNNDNGVCEIIKEL